MKNANEQVADKMVTDYVERVEKFVFLVHGLGGVKKMAENPIPYMREYNARCSMPVEKYLMLPHDARKELETVIMKNVYNRINEKGR